MAATGRSFWPEDIDVDVLSPREILQMQVDALGEITKGLVTAEVTESVDPKDQRVWLRLTMVAPALGNYRREILTVGYAADLYYPARVDADCFRGRLDTEIREMVQKTASLWLAPGEPVAATDRELEALVKVVLRSNEVKAVLASLLAKSKETLRASGKAPPANS